MQKPSFDTWTIIFLFSAIQGFFVSSVLLFKKDKHPSRKILATITILFSLILIDYVLYWTGYQYYYPYLINVPLCLIFLFGPLFYLYFKSIFNKKGFEKLDLLHFLPFLVALIAFGPVIFKSVSAKQDILTGKSPVNQNLSITFVWLGIASMITYCLLVFRHFYALSLENTEIRKWFRWLFGFFIGFIISYLSYFILVHFSFFNSAWDYSISFCIMFFIFFVAWFGYMQPKVFCGFSVFEQEKIKYKSSPISGDPGKEITENLQKRMAEKKYFLYSDLSLEKLSELMETNKHYLSQAINENLEMNFFEYINTLRIKEAKELLISKRDLTIIEIAYQVGYNNKVSFNKAFKNITGVTPTDYRNSN